MNSLLTVTFIDNPKNKEHRPHHIFRCRVACGGTEVNCVAKKNDHCEGEFLAALNQTVMRTCLPGFYGVFVPTRGSRRYCLLADIRDGFASPCLADVKVGTRQWDLSASEPYRSKLIARCARSQSAALGLRLVSCTAQRRGYIYEDTTKSWNRSLSEEALRAKIRWFLPRPLLPAVAGRVLSLRDCYMKLRDAFPNFQWYSGSILISYDGDDLERPPRVCFVDFAHAHFDIAKGGEDPTQSEFDDGILFGLNSFLRILAEPAPRKQYVPRVSPRGRARRPGKETAKGKQSGMNTKMRQRAVVTALQPGSEIPPCRGDYH
jgi:hypothetical protein